MRRLFWACCYLVVVAGLSLGLLRSLAPRLVDNPEWVGRVLGETLGLPVAIGDVDLYFDGWVPVLTLDDVTVRAEASAAPLAQFSRLDVRSGSILRAWEHRFAPRELTVYGLQLTVERLLDGQIVVAHSGLTNDGPSDLDRWNQLLERQVSIRLVDADIVWDDQLKLKQPVVLKRCRLTVSAVAAGLKAGLVAPLPEGAGATLRAQISTRGNPLRGDWDGEISGAVDGLAIGPVLDVLELTPAVPLTGTLNVTGGVAIESGDVTGAELLIDVKGLAEASDAGAAQGPVQNLGLAAFSRLSDDRWATRVQVKGPAGGQVDAEIAVRPEWAGIESQAARFSARRVDLTWLRNLTVVALRAARGAADPVAEALEAAALGGEVEYLELGIEWREGVLWPALDLRVRELTGPGQGNWPALDVPMIQIAGDREALSLHLPQQRAEVDARPFFIAPLTLEIESVDAALLQPLSPTPTLYVDDAKLVLQGFPLRLAGTVADITGGAEAALALTLGGGEVARAPELIPPDAISADGDAWLRRGLVGGNVISGRMLLRGPLAEFPFAGTEGMFFAQINARQAIVDYDAAWPRIEEADMRVVFEGTRLGIEVADARMMRAKLGRSRFEIPDLDAEDYVLTVDGNVTTSWPALLEFVGASPLKEGGAKQLSDLDVAGEVGIALGLTIPLETDDDTQISGQLKFRDNDFTHEGFDLSVQSLRGDIGFGRDDWSGRALTGRYAGEPVTLDIAGGIPDPLYDIALAVRGNSRLTFLNERFATIAPDTHALVNGPGRLDALSGTVPWQLGLKIPDGDVAPANSALELSFAADLDAVRGDLPWPFDEAVTSSAKLDVLAYVDGVSPETSRVTLGDGFGLYFTEDDDGITGMDVTLGPHRPPQPAAGTLRITGRLARLPLEDLAALVSFEPPSAGESAPTPTGQGVPATGAQPGAATDGEPASNGESAPADGIADNLSMQANLNVGTLEAGTQSFSPVRLTLTQTRRDYDLTLDGPAIAGQILLNEDENGAQTATATLSRLALAKLENPSADDGAGSTPDVGTAKPLASGSSAKAAGSDGGDHLDPRTLPNLRVSVSDLRYGDNSLGRLELNADKSPIGLNVTTVSLVNPEFQITGDGVWQRTDAHEQSRFRLNAEATKLATMLGTFGYATEAITGAKSKLGLDAAWPGGPTDFALETLQGHLDLELGKGRLLDIEPGGGRLFGLLSIQALPRRLSLDFNDLVAEGLAFDRIEGHFDIEGGDAFTNNLFLTGPSVQINIVGRTGLAAKDYDQQVTVTPQLAENLPVAGALFGPVGIGVGAAIYLGGKLFQALPDQVDRILKREYTVTGLWDDPIVE